MKYKFPTFKSRRTVLLVLLAGVCILALLAFDTRLYVRHYTLEADAIRTRVRIALVTDLHSCDWGEGQDDLISAIDAQKPDLLLLGGDIFDDEMDDENTAEFIAGVAGRYPIYYVTGNHECWSGRERFDRKMSVLAQYGIPILSDTFVTLSVNGEALTLCGMDDPHIYMVSPQSGTGTQTISDADGYAVSEFEKRLKTLNEAVQGSGYTILLSHRPELYDLYEACAFDLVLCGHAHGGQWRIPFLLNGLYAPHQGVFPAYAGGRYDSEDMTMIVSRGLARETTRVPRIFNRPELVIVDLN